MARVLLNRQTSQAHATALRHIFQGTTRRCPAFENGKKLLGITVDFSDAEAKGLRDVLGRDIADKILRGCKVYISNESYNYLTPHLVLGESNGVL